MAHHRGTPVGTVVHIYPFAVSGQIIAPHGRILNDSILGGGAGALDNHAGAFIVPVVKRIAFGAIERGWLGRQIAGIHPDAGAVRGSDFTALVRSYAGAAPPHRHRHGAGAVNINTHHGVCGDLHCRRRREEHKIAAAAC